MNIGIVTTWFERGAAYVSRQFMDVLQKTDTVFIYARGGESAATDNPKWNLPNVHWSKQYRGKKELFGSTYIEKKDFVQWAINNKIEAVIFNEQRWFQPILWCKELGIKTFAYVDYYTEQTLPLFDAFDALICNTKRHAFAFRNHHNAFYLKWGTDPTMYKPCCKKKDKLTFFHSAGMAPIRKGTDLLIKSFYACKNRDKAKLVIHTQVSLKKTIPEVSEYIDIMISDGGLEIVEKTVTAPGLYYYGDVYVYPSRLDGIGLTLMEAIASGMAVVTVNNAPMNEFIEDTFGVLCDIDYYYSRSDGYYWPIGVANIDSLSSILTKFINEEMDLYSMKLKARQYAEKELDFNVNCKSLQKILKDVEFLPVSTELSERICSYDNSSILRYRSLYPFYYSFKTIIKKVFARLFT